MNAPSQRYYSLDVFRGATVAFMILVNNQPGAAYGPLDHAPWHGLTPTDLVFPFFLFAVGNALAFVMPRFEQQGTKAFLRKVLKRTLLIFVIGFLLNWFPFFHWDHGRLIPTAWEYTNDQGQLAGIRVMGVLQRIALCYGLGAIIVYFAKLRGAFFLAGCMLLLYWAWCLLLGTPGDPYSIDGYFGTAVDKAVFGPLHMYHGEGVAFDPEGIASTLPAIVNVILGYFAGTYLQKKGKSYETLTHFFVAALILLFAGYLWGTIFPINKKIWTSSYVLVSAGWALACLSLLIYFIEFRGARGGTGEGAGSASAVGSGYRPGWSRFCDVFGKNPLFIFIVAGAFPRLVRLIRWQENGDYTNPMAWFLHKICDPLSGGRAENASLIYAGTLIILYWLLAWTLDRKRIYIRV
jgi:predicted acyltransferase